MIIRKATIADLDIVTNIEMKCFLPTEAAGKESFRYRLEAFHNHFLILEDDGEYIGMVNGMVTIEKDLVDEMYHDASIHNEDGSWQMIFGLAVKPEYRKKGFAAKLLFSFIDEAKKENRKGLVLTCKDHMVHYYKKFGFLDEGMSVSEHGGVSWHQMRLVF